MRVAGWPRRAGVAALAALGLAGAAAGQQLPDDARRGLEREIRWSARDTEMPKLPPLSEIAVGGTTIEPGATRAGPVVAARGDLVVRGTVTGDAVAIDGNVVVPTGGRVTGNAYSVRGRVRLDGGIVDGHSVVLSAIVPPSEAAVAAAMSPWAATSRAVQITVTLLAIALAMAFGLLLFAGEKLDVVARTLESRFGRSFLVGVVGQLALAPLLLVLIVALAITIIGLLLIPFAAVAYVLAAAGMLTLGFFAVAELTGMPFVGAGVLPRRAALRALLLGTVIYLGLWVIAAAFTWQPVAGAILRMLAAVVTWVAMTAGFGAVILSRGGVRRTMAALPIAPVEDSRSWETPTPVGGVAAARRPTPAGLRGQP